MIIMSKERLDAVEESIISLLQECRGCDPVHGRDLAHYAGLVSIRTGRPQTALLRWVVNGLRHKGLPVASDSDGYFWATTPEELASTVKQLKSRAISIGRVYGAIVKTQKRLRDDRAPVGRA